MDKIELMDFMQWYAGDETMSYERTKELEQIVDIYLGAEKPVSKISSGYAEKEFTLKRYATVDEIVLASFQIEDESLTLKDLMESTLGGFDQNESEMEFSYEQQKDGIVEQGHWGWIDRNKVIHYWIGKELTMEDLIHFFAHEIGHRTGESDKDYFQEEMRAEGYGKAATLAYKFAKLIKG